MGLFEYTNGIQTFVQSDLNQYDYKSKWKTNHPIVIRGEKGVLDVTEYEIQMLGDGKGWKTIPADIPKEKIDPIGGETNGKLVKELIELLDGEISNHRCSGDNAKKTLDIMMSIYQSARTNEKVNFPVTEKEYPLELMTNEDKFNLKVKEKYDIRGFLDRSNVDEDDYLKLKKQGIPHHLLMQKVKRK